MKSLIDKLVSAGIEESEARKEILILQKEFHDESKIREVVNKRTKTRIPIQYLIGKAYFMDFEVKVTPDVLIPRPETEILVEETVKRLQIVDCGFRNEKYSVLDIGTGSGIIAIALARLIPNIKITATDIKKDIINLAQENAKLNNVEGNINFIVCDLFSSKMEEVFRQNKFDLIISNPPYIKETLMLQPEVRHEPRVALFGTQKNNLIYYKRIIKLAKNYLKALALKILALEIDPTLVCGLRNLLKKENMANFEIIKDYAKLDRFLFVTFDVSH